MKKLLLLALLTALFVSCSKDSDEDSGSLLVNSASEIQGKWSALTGSLDLKTYEFSGNVWKWEYKDHKTLYTSRTEGTFSVSKGKITFSYNGETNPWGDKIEDRVESIEWADEAKSALLIDKLKFTRK